MIDNYRDLDLEADLKDFSVYCTRCNNCNGGDCRGRYEKKLEEWNKERLFYFKLYLESKCSHCLKGQHYSCPTYVLYKYLKENYPNGYSVRQLLMLPPELRPSLCHYVYEVGKFID